jgi:hypothetical protein
MQLEFFYCYSRNVSSFLTSKGIKYITVAIEPNSKRYYSMYLQTNELTEALNEYKQLKNHN